ncbi:MAG: sulfotransferase domain-containing protein [Actinomycetota bacterium]
MTLPNFLGIGVPRGGSTWLHSWLEDHPAIYMPTRRKEIRFFDRHFEEGIDWYRSFFPTAADAGRYQAIGEVSPQYFYCDECPQRIFNTLPDARLMLMLRHPVARAYSNYGFTVQRGNYRGSFEQFISERPSALEWGFYSRYAKPYLRYFDRSRILALVFEEVFTNPEQTRLRVGGFLGIPPNQFPTDGFRKQVNPSSVPRFQSVSGYTVKAGRRLRKLQLEPAVDLARRLGIQRLIARGQPLAELDPGLRHKLSRQFTDEFDELEKCLDVDLSSWRV